ncbi:hypothetical protein ACVI1I_006256 [Bradyrhizobium sp. USDA 4459]
MPAHLILASSRAAEFAARRFPTRPLTIIQDATALERFLASCRASSLTFCGTWPQLTVATSRSLAEWACQDSMRGCGLYLASDHCDLDRSYSIDGDSSVCEAFDGEVAREYRRDGTAEFRINDLLAHLTDDKRPRPAGMVLTGHGAEHCVQLGSKWLSTFETSFLNAPVILPRFQLAAAVFLNCCSSMRLGDSCVPQQYSLARTLFAAGSAVIGSFRNLQILPQYGETFARALLAGQPLGQIVNNLNMQADTLERTGCAFQLLGDPSINYPANLSSPQVPAPSVGVTNTERAIVADLVDDIAWLERFADTLLHWLPQSRLAACYMRLLRLTSRAGCIDYATRIGALAATELSTAIQDLTERSSKMRAALFEILTSSIRKEGWIQLRYAAHCRRGDAVRAVCKRCGGVSYVTCYHPLASQLLPVEREECDRCGTTMERIGLECPPHISLSSISENPFTIALSELPQFAEGAIFFHRMRDFVARPWPHNGGIVSIATAQLSFQGRLTLVAAALERQVVTLQYHTFFIDPKLDQ